MFIEKNHKHVSRAGSVEVIAGSMFSGKTEELIRRMKRARIANLKTEMFKPHIDKRYDDSDVVSHDKNALNAIPVESSSQLLLMTSDVDVIGIDEAQFFDMGLPDICNQLANNGVRVIVAGLDMDFKGNPFGPMPYLMAIADFVTKVHAICIECGALAQFSFRKVHEDKQILIGETDSYQPLCRECYNKKINNS
jgi:thymidine kinase